VAQGAYCAGPNRLAGEKSMIYAINYDLKQPGRDYTGLYETIKNCGEWWHYLGSTWLVDTHLGAEGIWQRISQHFDPNDMALVIGVTSDYQGWLPKEAWDWVNGRRASAA
jgi:hypothetical protein